MNSVEGFVVGCLSSLLSLHWARAKVYLHPWDLVGISLQVRDHLRP